MSKDDFNDPIFYKRNAITEKKFIILNKLNKIDSHNDLLNTELFLIKQKILSEKASIKPYLITALIWIPICIVIIILLFKFLPSYGGYSVWGLSLAMLKAFNCLNHRYYNTNMQDLLRIQADYIL